MDHTPFIWGAYLAAGVVLLAVALAPRLKFRHHLASLRAALPKDSDTHAPHA